jgi:hypothetical protein
MATENLKGKLEVGQTHEKLVDTSAEAAINKSSQSTSLPLSTDR